MKSGSNASASTRRGASVSRAKPRWPNATSKWAVAANPKAARVANGGPRVVIPASATSIGVTTGVIAVSVGVVIGAGPIAGNAEATGVETVETAVTAVIAPRKRLTSASPDA